MCAAADSVARWRFYWRRGEIQGVVYVHNLTPKLSTGCAVLTECSYPERYLVPRSCSLASGWNYSPTPRRAVGWTWKCLRDTVKVPVNRHCIILQSPDGHIKPRQLPAWIAHVNSELEQCYEMSFEPTNGRRPLKTLNRFGDMIRYVIPDSG